MGPQGPQGPPWAPMGPHGAHGAPMGPMGPSSSYCPRILQENSRFFMKNHQKSGFLTNLANVHPKIMNKKVEIWIFRLSRMVHDSIKSTELGFMVQDLFSGPKFVYSVPFWVYRGSVSVEQRQCLCGTETLCATDTVPLWDRHSVCVEQTQCLCGTHTVSLCGPHTVLGGGRLRGYSGVTGSYQIHTHIPDIASPQLRGD